MTQDFMSVKEVITHIAKTALVDDLDAAETAFVRAAYDGEIEVFTAGPERRSIPRLNWAPCRRCQAGLEPDWARATRGCRAPMAQNPAEAIE
jgi:hypothetical protein